MPLIKLRTNVTIETDNTPQLMQDLSTLLAEETGKPERYVMIEIAGDRNMLFGGSPAPTAYIECKSIGLSTSQAKSISKALNALLHTRLQIDTDRIYVEFSNCPAEYWGWNGSTFG